jgi:hypothetical protein
MRFPKQASWHEARYDLGNAGGCTVEPREPASFWVGPIAGAHMTDKHRHRPTPAPHGHLSNWLLFAFFACSVAVAGLAHALV